VPDPQPVFLYDLGDPECYLAAERVNATLPVVPEWEPVLWPPATEIDVEALAARVAAAGLQPLRMPPGWPPDTGTAMLAATYAKHVGRAVAFSLAAFRQAFAGGRDLSDPDTVLIAGAACEMHPAALLKAIELRSVREGLEAAGRRARRAGVTALPAIVAGRAVYEGPEALERAAEAFAPR
jgi:2-hydroxychromene-2-carboxylate isomerase